jgi:hypothetical protein
MTIGACVMCGHTSGHAADCLTLATYLPDYVPDPVGDEQKRLLAQERLKEQLRPLIRTMLADAGAHGVTPHAVRFAAESRGWVTGKETGRFLSFLAGLFKAAGAVPGAYVQSKHPSRRGAVTRCWILKEYAE